MRGYDREEVDDYDEYEDEREELGEDGEEEDVYEEEVERKPSAEELEYLELRARIKEQIRKKMQKENGSALSKSQEKKKISDNYGSFFGPSQPVIAQRVIQESKSLLENQELAYKVSKSLHGNKNGSSSGATSSRTGVPQKLPKVKNELKMKVQKLKDTRDYSFLLSDDAELPASTKEPAPRHIPVPKSEARSSQVLQKSKHPPRNNGRSVHVGREERKPVALNGQMHSKAGSYKPTSPSKPNTPSIDPRRQLGSNNGIGPGRPSGPKGLTSKTAVVPFEKKPSAPGARNILPASHKPSPPLSKMQSSVPKQHLEQKKVVQEPSKTKMMSKQPVASSKPQLKRPVKQISSHASLQDNRPKKRPVRKFSDDEDDEDVKALSMIRRMFNTRRFADRDDDDSDMEANFDDIMMEEQRSARIARKEDEEELRLIEEEERRERMRKLAKKRKLG